MSLYKENYSKYIAEYSKMNYDRIELKVPKGYKDYLKHILQPKKISMNKFIFEAIEDKLKGE